jgi:quinol monooxygenase YgiN
MTILVLVEVKVKPQCLNELTTLLRELLPATRAFPGCESVAAALSEDGNSLTLVERWGSKEDRQKYASWRMTTDHGRQLVALLDGPLSIRYIDPLEV